MQEGSVRMVVAIPAYNEEKSIARVVVEAQKQTPRVIVCDDGSTDMTGEIAGRLGVAVIRHQTNLGKGVAIKDLFSRAKEMGAEIVVTLDGDGQHDPHQIPRLVQPLLDGEADIVIGSRFLEDIEDLKVPGYRRVGNGMLNRLTNLISGGDATDTQSGFRAYSSRALETLEVKEHAIGVDAQLLVEASQQHLRVVEVPTVMRYDEDSSTYHPAKHGLYVVLALIRTFTERSPLLYLGVPGLVSFLVGVFFSGATISLYDTSQYFSLPMAILALGGIAIGLVLIVAAMILYAINNLVLRLRKG